MERVQIDEETGSAWFKIDAFTQEARHCDSASIPKAPSLSLKMKAALSTKALNNMSAMLS
jgi:hypothetical protein